MATATAALAACVASRSAADVAAADAEAAAGVDAGCPTLEVSAVGSGTAGIICVPLPPFGPVGAADPAGPLVFRDAAVSLTSCTLGLVETGGGGPLLGAACAAT
jgi:hypothetical protein